MVIEKVEQASSLLSKLTTGRIPVLLLSGRSEIARYLRMPRSLTQGVLFPCKIGRSLLDKMGDTFLEIVAFKAGRHIEIGCVGCFCECLK